MHTSDDFKAMLEKLLPKGKLWNDLIVDPVFSGILQAVGDEFELIDTRSDDLIEETDPRTALELLDEWESYYNLPDSCVDPVPSTTSERHAALWSKRIEMGGQSKAYFIALAASIGYTITIFDNYQPWTFNDSFDLPWNTQEWRFVWRVIYPSFPPIVWWTFEDGFDEPFRSWGLTDLLCLLNKHKPAHTVLLVASS